MYREIWAQIEEISHIAEEVYQVTLLLEEEFVFAEGQYIWLVLSKLNFPDPKGERRIFSITSPKTEKNILMIQFKASNSGYKRTLLSLKSGGLVKVIGPFGSAYVPKPDQKSIAMIAEGVNIAPFLCILRSLKSMSFVPKLALIYVNPSPASGVFYEELKQIAQENSVSFINHVGDFKGSLFSESTDYANDIFYISGSSDMVDAVYKFLNSNGVPFEHMHFEQHYPTPVGNLTEKDFIQVPGQRNIMLQAVNDSKNHVIITDANGIIIFANKTAEKNTGYTFDEMRGNTTRIWGGLMPAEFYRNLWRKKNDSMGFDGEIMNRKKNGDIYYALTHISPIKNEKGVIVGYIGTEEDLTKEKMLDKVKTEFISLASHQLRTPLTTINWYCEVLLSGSVGQITEEQRKFIEEAHKGSLRMSKLVAALLNVSRIESGTYMVNLEMVDVVKIVKSVLDDLKLQIEEKNLTIKLVKENIPQMMLDPNLMMIISQNLIMNSIKYTQGGGKINIDLRVVKKGDNLGDYEIDQDSLLLSIEDNGMGIPSSQKYMIFQKLFRADNVRKVSNDGTGLGLYLVKSLVNHSGGKIWFVSEEGKGTTFYVVIPLCGMAKREGTRVLVRP